MQCSTTEPQEHDRNCQNRLREAHLHARRPRRGLDLTAVHRRNRFEWASARIRWRLALWRGVLFMDESWFSLYRLDGRQRVWRHVGERFADVNVVDRVAHGGGGVMVQADVCYGQWTQVHAQRYRDEEGSVHNSWKLKTSQFLHGQHTHRHVTHWACLRCSGSAYTRACSSSWQYPATSHSHWRGVDQHSTGHNQQPDQLYAKEVRCTVWGKWWSHQILTGFWTPTGHPTPPPPPNTVKLHVL